MLERLYKQLGGFYHLGCYAIIKDYFMIYFVSFGFAPASCFYLLCVLYLDIFLLREREKENERDRESVTCEGVKYSNVI